MHRRTNMHFVGFNLGSSFIQALLLGIGLWKLFPKFGVKKIWAFVPFGRLYKLAVCADCEEDGLACLVFSAISYFFAVLISFMQRYPQDFEKAILISSVITLVLTVILFVYYIRLYCGLCRVFGRKYWWVILWIIADFIPAIIWGWSKKFQPVNSRKLNAAALSGTTEAASSEGLVVNIRKRTAGSLFRRRTLLRDIHFTIEPGNMVLLLGGSGAGKTTLVNAITGYEKASASVTLNGDDVYRNFDSMKYQIGFVPQQETIRLNDSVYRTISDNAYLRLPDTVSDDEIEKKVNSVMDIFGLTPARHSFVSKQSGGMKKRISISMEYVSDPDLFVLDEPDSGLDGIMARSLMEKLHAISREGKIVMVITHTPDRVIDLFDKVIVLARDSARTGRLAFYGSVDETKKFFERDTMEDIVRIINRIDEGGEGRADEMIERFEEERK